MRILKNNKKCIKNYYMDGKKTHKKNLNFQYPSVAFISVTVRDGRKRRHITGKAIDLINS